MDYSHFAVLFMVFGLALLIAEVFVPSAGMILVLSLACFGGSAWCAWQAWWETSRTTWWVYLVALVILMPSTLGAAFYLLQRTPLGRRILLEAPTLEEVTPYAAEEEHLLQMVGRIGKTLTMLNPSGLVLVDGERTQCESEGLLIEQDETVRIVGVKGNSLVVRVTDNEQGPSDELVARTDSPDQPPLDFDVPQS